MIFLKKFWAHGFKSYADIVELNFLNRMTGIVGPNGAGKSNIVDGIKWVLGEQSLKTLRGKVSDDVIFHGSKGKEEASFAEVRLTFVNSDNIINFEGKEVEISRKVVRGESGNEYFINGQPARLKDIQEMFLDTGLSKGSLGIIGQGTVQWFAEAKPEDRRKIFEEAAGIGKYTKRKQESLRQLEKAKENLNRVSDIVNELTKDVKKLQKQAEKAQIYNEKKKFLSNIEITLLVKDIEYYSNKAIEFKEKSLKLSEAVSSIKTDSSEAEDKLQIFKSKDFETENLISDLSKRLSQLNDEIIQAESQKVILDQSLSNAVNSKDSKQKIEGLKQQIEILSAEIEDRKIRAQKITNESSVFKDTKKVIDAKLDELRLKSSTLTNEVMNLKSRKRVLEEQMQNNGNLFEGVRTILAHKNHLNGINDIVANLIKVENKYQKALEVALGPAQQNIVVDKDIDAVSAIKFLRQNQAGTATFLPLETIRYRQVSDDHKTILKQLEGFEGIAAELVTFEKKFLPAIYSLLGTLIVASDVNTAANLSKYTYQAYRVVSLDGDLIQAGGAMTGGFRKQNNFSLNLKENIEQINAKLPELETEISSIRLEIEKLLIESNSISSKLTEKQISYAKIEEFLQANVNRITILKLDYEKISGSSFVVGMSTSNEIIDRLNSLLAKRDKTQEELKIARNLKINYSSQTNDLYNKFLDSKKTFDKQKDELTKIDENLIKVTNIVEKAKTRLTEVYKMTFDFAKQNYNKELPESEEKIRETVANLRRDIEALEPINTVAIEEFNEKDAKLKELSKQKKELEDANDEILNTIKEIDSLAINSFDSIIKNINLSLPAVFHYLFGGGNCVINYTDPEHILESGIEIIANPPGKKVTSLNLLSGGEKTLVALSVLFSILQVRKFPLIILDEAESALDPANVERFGKIIHENSLNTQFIVITHRPGTMERCDALFGATMQTKGVTKMLSVNLSQAEKYIEQKN